MNRIEFLERLEELLLDIPYTERREALNYYTEYFEDAEKEDEEVIKTLGSPEEVAHNIREELAGKELVKSSFCNGGSAAEEKTTQEGEADNPADNKKTLEGWQIALIVVAAVVTVPVWGGIISAAGGAILGMIAAYFGIILALALVAVACFAAAVLIFVVAIVKIAVSPVASLFLLGLSVFLLGFAMLCLIGSWKSITVLTPAIFRGMAYIFKSVFHKKEGVAA